MSDQYYRLDRSWTVEEWPGPDVNASGLRKLNEVTPMKYRYSLTRLKDESDRVELLEYVGDSLEEDDG